MRILSVSAKGEPTKPTIGTKLTILTTNSIDQNMDVVYVSKCSNWASFIACMPGFEAPAEKRRRDVAFLFVKQPTSPRPSNFSAVRLS